MEPLCRTPPPCLTPHPPPLAGILTAKKAQQQVRCLLLDSYLRSDGIPKEMTKTCQKRVVPSAGVTVIRFGQLAPSCNFVKFDVQGGHSQSDVNESLKTPSLDTLKLTAQPMLDLFLSPAYAGGFAGGAGPLQAIKTYAEDNGRTLHSWTPMMLSLLSEGVEGPALRMTDLASARKYRPTLVLGGDAAHTVFVGKQYGSSLCAAFGSIDVSQYISGNTTAALLLGGKARTLAAPQTHALAHRASQSFPEAGDTADRVGRRRRRGWLSVRRGSELKEGSKGDDAQDAARPQCTHGHRLLDAGAGRRRD